MTNQNPPTNDRDDQIPIVSADLSCLKCNIETTKLYDPGITYTDFIDDKPKLICPECNSTYSSLPHFSVDVWRSKLLEKYQNLKQVANDNLPGLWDSLEFELSIQKILNIKDCTLPFAGIVLGRPSSLKTIGIELFRKWIDTYYTDNFSAKSFVSHSTAVTRENLAAIDMLPKIKNKLFLTPELSPTFSKKDDELIDVLGILTRVLDGHGYESDTGAHGHRGYNEPMMFTWIGAAVDIPYKVHKYLGTLGPKLYFLRLPNNSRSENDYYDELDKDFAEKLAKVRVVLFDYLNWFQKGPELEKDEKNSLLKMPWNLDKNEELAKRYIIKLAILLAHLRAVVPTWETNDPTSQGLDYAYALATIEDPSRAITQLRNLARGHALSQGRNFITLQDIPLLIKVVFSTASQERVRVSELLIENKGSLTTSQITESLNTSNNTAKRTMAELKAVGLVTVSDVTGYSGKPEKQITLKDEFDWFLGEDFTNVRNLPPYSYPNNNDNDNNNYSNVRNLPPYSYSSTTTNDKNLEIGLGGNFSYIQNDTKITKNELKDSDNSISRSKDEATKDENKGRILPRGVTSVTSVTCENCGEKLEPFYTRIHRCGGDRAD